MATLLEAVRKTPTKSQEFWKAQGCDLSTLDYIRLVLDEDDALYQQIEEKLQEAAELIVDACIEHAQPQFAEVRSEYLNQAVDALMETATSAGLQSDFVMAQSGLPEAPTEAKPAKAKKEQTKLSL